MTSKDLGLVTAYAYAVSQGYTGTEEEFAELMASYATVAEEAAESAAEAAASAEAAGASETNAASSAASAGQSATSAGNSATSASGSAVQAQSSATAAWQSATQAAGSATAAGNSATAAAGSASQAAASETAAGASATAAAGSATSASGSATAAAGSATEADASADRAQEILDSIPEDYSELSEDVSDLKSALNVIADGIVSDGATTGWESGSLYYTNGVEIGADNRIRTEYLADSIAMLSVDNGYKYRIFCYKRSDDSYVGTYNGSAIGIETSFNTSPINLIPILTDYKIRVVLSKTDDSTMTPSFGTHIHLSTFINTMLPNQIVNFNSLNNLLSNNVVNGNYEVQAITWGIDNRYINPNTGAISDAESINVHVSGYIDVSNVPYIRLTASPHYSFSCLAFYDLYKTFIRAYPSASSNVNYWMEEIQVPSNAKYAVFGNNSAISGKLAVKIEFMTSYASLSNRKWTGKKWACVGDSLTEINNRATMRYMDYIQIETGIRPYNMGVSGTGYAKGHSANKAFIDRISSVPTDSDIVTIFGSNNDMFGENWEVGEITDTGTTTLCGFINGTIDALYQAFPTAKLGIITPCPWENIYPSATTTIGRKGIAYSKALVDICAYRGIPCLDLFHCSGMRPWEANYRALFYTGDEGGGVHPDANGHRILASHIGAFLDTLLV